MVPVCECPYSLAAMLEMAELKLVTIVIVDPLTFAIREFNHIYLRLR